MNRSIFITCFLVVLLYKFCFSQQLDTTALQQKIDSLILSSDLFLKEKKYDLANQVIDSAIQITTHYFGNEKLITARCLFQKGNILYSKGNSNESIDQFSKALPIYKNVLGEQHEDYLKCVQSLADVYVRVGKFKESEPLLLEVLNAKEINGKNGDKDYLSVLYKLGRVYYSQSLYVRANEVLSQAKEKADTLLDRDDRLNESIRLTLGLANRWLGNFRIAEVYDLEVLDMRAHNPGKISVDYAGSLINLATLYTDTKNFEKSEALFLEAKNTFEKELKDTMHPYYGNCLKNMAILYAEMGRNLKADTIYQLVENLFNRKGDVNSYSYAGLMIDRGNLKMKISTTEEGEHYYLRANEVFDANPSFKKYAYFPALLNGLGNIYIRKKDWSSAIKVRKEILKLDEELIGKYTFRYAIGIRAVGYAYYYNGNIDSSLWYMEEGDKILRTIFNRLSQNLSEKELYDFIHYYEEKLNVSYSFLADAWKVPAFIMHEYNNILFYRGLLLNTASRISSLLHSSVTKQEDINEIRSLNIKLDSEYSKSTSDESKINALEWELSKKMGNLLNNRNIPPVLDSSTNWRTVWNHLKSDEAAIEFISYRGYFGRRVSDTTTYGALIITKQDSAPHYVKLFNLDESLSKDYRKTQVYINEAYSALPEESKDSIISITQLIWGPILKDLKDIHTIYYVPTRLLNQFNLGSIAYDSQSTFAEHYDCVQLVSTRQLTDSVKERIGSNDVGLFGSIVYELDTIMQDQAASSMTFEPGNNIISFDSTYGENIELRGKDWTYLKGSAKEIQKIQPYITNAGMSLTLFNYKAGSEEAFKQLGRSGIREYSPRVIHLSTHGFFFPDPKVQVNKNIPSVGDPVFKISENPMIRSGLILAGGNYAWKHGHPYKPGMEDGILTAYEISQMDLSNTELVVLSACETGLGDIQGNEGVYGLQRAFKIAGVKNLIMSLWQVPDAATAELMTSFYKHWLEDKMAIREALHQAQKEMRDQGMEPYEWAGFILVE